ncbi:MAG: hypothetical protein EA369_07520 [Bradymonadales bacterium]|nr:MAG: hypothetical protein EA369_07520 [Bradymonadales bacterium]
MGLEDRLLSDFLELLPRLLGALLCLILGWGLAEWAGRVSRRLLKRFKLDDLSEESGFDSFLIESGIRQTASGLVSVFLYWAILIGFILASIHILGIDAAGVLFVRFAVYLPQVLVALVVLVVGILLARFVRSASFSYLNKIQAQGARVISFAAFVAIIVFTVSITLETLGIGGPILVSAFQIVFGSICLAFAIAFGLGGRHWAGGVVERLLKK